MLTRWYCIGAPPKTPPCGESGTYEHTAKTADSGPAWQHVRDTKHSTFTSVWEWGAA